MLETTSEISLSGNKPLNPLPQQFTLPVIPQRTASRGDSVQSQAPKQPKLILPNIADQHDQSQNHQARNNRTQTSSFHKQRELNSSQGRGEPSKTRFALEVEEKLKLVLEGMQEEVNIEEGGSLDSDDFDFQAKINANRELIKMHRLKKQNEQNLPANKNAFQNPPKSKKLTRPKVESLYQKRVREYKDQSLENKYLQRRKQTIIDKSISPPVQEQETLGQVRESLRQIKPKDFVSVKQGLKKQAHSTKKVDPRAPSHKSLKPSNKNIKPTNLFDGIQNYLENPREERKNNGDKPLIGLSLLKAKRDIEDKIKAINQKLGILDGESFVPVKVDGEGIPNQTVRNWRKMEIRERRIRHQESNFDKELDRINALQEHNSHSLQHYLDHQKILLQLEMRRKILGSQTNTQ